MTHNANTTRTADSEEWRALISEIAELRAEIANARTTRFDRLEVVDLVARRIEVRHGEASTEIHPGEVELCCGENRTKAGAHADEAYVFVTTPHGSDVIRAGTSSPR